MKDLESGSLASRQSSIRFLLLMMVLLSVFPLDVILPSFPAIAAHFSTPAEHISLSVSTFAIGFAIFQWVIGPLSDRLGRKRLLMLGMVVSIAGAVGCASSTTFSNFILFRCIQAMGCGCFVLSNALVQDVFVGEQRDRLRILMTTASGVFISLSPLLGTWLQSLFGWTGSFYLFAGIASVVLAHAAWVLPDPVMPPPTTGFWKTGITIALNGQFMGFSFIAAIAFTCHFSFIAISPVIFLEKFGLTQIEFSWVLLGYGTAYVAGGLIASRLQKLIGHRQQLNVGMVLIGLAGVVMLAISLVSDSGVIGILLPMMICTTGTTIARPAATSRAMDIFPAHAGAASSLINTTVFVMGGVVSAVVSVWAFASEYVLASAFIGLGVVGWMIVMRLYSWRGISPKSQTGRESL